MHLIEIKKITLFITLLASLCVSAQESSTQYGRSDMAYAPNIELELLSARQSVAPGETFDLAVRILPNEDWHIYWQNPGDTGLPTKVTWQENESLSFSELEWSIPSRADYQGFINYGYYGETYLFAEVSVSEAATAGEPLSLGTKVDWLICEEICIPGSAELSLELMIEDQGLNSPWYQQLEQAHERLPEDLGKLAGSYTTEDGFRIAIQLTDELQTLEPVQFFPISPKLVNNLNVPNLAKPQADTLVISTDNAANTPVYPEVFEGLLILEDQQGVQFAYEFEVDADPSVAMASVIEPAANLPFLLILLFALIGGLVLNLMPCVLPVLSLKVMHLVEESDSANRHIQGIAYTAGVVLSFLVIAGVMLTLRAAGENIGWGFQLQSPVFVAVLIYVVFVLGLSLSGFLELGASLMRFGSIGSHLSGPISGSFMTGALATIVATPCTAPFMGAAMGAAVTMSTPLALLVFATLGFGLALPFLLISFVPAFARAMPSPGQWMVTLKEALAFPLYLTAIWLLWVFANQTNVDQLAALMGGLVLIVFGIWLTRINRDGKRWILATTLAAWILALAILPNIETTSGQQGIVKIAYSDQALASARTNDQAVFVNLTADWCITCKVNERVALRNSEVEALFAEQGIVYLEGDWTNADENITELLARFDRNGVPLYLAYLPGESEPQVLPQILTPSIVIEAFSG
jgi:thiol:disulfide interchange protein